MWFGPRISLPLTCLGQGVYALQVFASQIILTLGIILIEF